MNSGTELELTTTASGGRNGEVVGVDEPPVDSAVAGPDVLHVQVGLVEVDDLHADPVPVLVVDPQVLLGVVAVVVIAWP